MTRIQTITKLFRENLVYNLPMKNITPTTSDSDRLDEVEMALMLFMCLLTGEPADATGEEKTAVQVELAGLMKTIAARHRP